MNDRLVPHDVVLGSGDLILRPLTEDDWDVLMIEASDPEVLYYSEGDRVSSYTLEEVKGIYRPVSKEAFCFIIEWNGRPIGSCWLQRMNVRRLLERFPGKDLRRIDLAIGVRDCWNRGLGTRTIGLLTEFAFTSQGADAVFGLFVADYNARSRRAFEKNGFTIDQEVPHPPGGKARVSYDLMLTRERFNESRRAG